jgi:hypothetical protein
MAGLKICEKKRARTRVQPIWLNNTNINIYFETHNKYIDYRYIPTLSRYNSDKSAIILISLPIYQTDTYAQISNRERYDFIFAGTDTYIRYQIRLSVEP